MSAFVGFKHNLSASELEALIKKYHTPKSRYFSRWAHCVSGIEREFPKNFPSPEGQMFDYDRELRWKQQGDRFSVLILSTQSEEAGFDAIAGNWKTKVLNASAYPETETRFPKGIQARKVNLAQRCFINDDTATVHFVALVAKE